MPIYKGSTKIGTISRGPTKIGKVYHGSTLVYQSAKPYFVGHESYTNVLSYSYDGITWYKSTLPLKGHCAGTAVGNGKVVITPYDSTDPNLDLIGFVSTDGANWSQTSVPARGISDRCIYGNKMFLGHSTTVSTSSYMTSYDGVNWTVRNIPSSGLFSFDYANGIYLAFNRQNSNIAYTSYNGINWTQHNLPVSSSYWSVMGSGNGNLNNTFYISNRSKQVYRSTDGINWTLVGTDNIDSDYKFGYAYSNGRFVSVVMTSNGTVITVYHSSDMCTWSPTGLTISISGRTHSATIASVPGKFVIMMYDGTGRAFYSTDGLNWGATTTPTTWNGYIAAGML